MCFIHGKKFLLFSFSVWLILDQGVKVGLALTCIFGLKSNCYSLIYSSLYWILFYWYIIGLYSSHPFSSVHYISLNKSEPRHCNLKLLLWHLFDTNVCCNSCSQLQPISVKGAAWNHSIAAHYTSDWYSVWLNPTRGRGADSARPEEKLHFWYILVIQLTRKNLTFPK